MIKLGELFNRRLFRSSFRRAILSSSSSSCFLNQDFQSSSVARRDGIGDSSVKKVQPSARPNCVRKLSFASSLSRQSLCFNLARIILAIHSQTGVNDLRFSMLIGIPPSTRRRCASRRSITGSKVPRALTFFLASAELILPRPSSNPINQTSAVGLP